MKKTTSVLAASIALASAKTIEIKAGPGLEFSPSSTTAEQGDVLEFHFYPKNHSVAQGFFANPCQPAQEGGFFSGYVPSQEDESPTMFSVVANDTNPIWFYRTQGRHCQGGMVGVVNAPENRTLEDYMRASESFNGTTTAPEFVYGGAVSQMGGSATTTGAPTSETGTGGQTGEGDANPANAGLALQPMFGTVLGALGIVALGLQ